MPVLNGIVQFFPPCLYLIGTHACIKHYYSQYSLIYFSCQLCLKNCQINLTENCGSNISKESRVIDKQISFQSNLQYYLITNRNRVIRINRQRNERRKKMNELKKYLLKVVSKAALATAIVAANTTCIGPAYQPEIPPCVEKLRMKK